MSKKRKFLHIIIACLVIITCMTGCQSPKQATVDNIEWTLWENDLIDGDGHYTGDIKYFEKKERGQPNGRGVWSSIRGDSYEGEWVDGYPDGTGTMIFHVNGSTITVLGSFKKGRMDGNCSWTEDDGIEIKETVGAWKNGKLETTYSEKKTKK